MAKKYLKFRTNFGIHDLETTIAEEDRNLPQYYVGRETYVDRAINREDAASVFIGPKGAGKSAVLQMVRHQANAGGNERRLVEIAPDDLAFNALVNIDARTPLLQSAAQNQWLFTSLWDFVICAEILHRETANHHALAKLLTKLFGNRNKKQQDQLLKITVDDDGKHLSMTDKMLALIDEIEIEGGYDKLTGKAKVTIGDPTSRSEDLQLLQLISSVAKNLPKNINHEYYVLIDDLDLHWTGTPLQNAFIAAMFLSVRKLSRERVIKFAVSLRHSIYRQITIEERDKFDPFVCEVEWPKSSIKQMVAKRMSYALNLREVDVWGKLFPESAFDFLWNNSDGMPRELIRLAVACVDIGIKVGEKSVSADTINKATQKFSEKRADELASLHKFNYPGLGLVIQLFKGRKKEFDISTILEVGAKIAELNENNKELPNVDWAVCGFEDPVSLARSLLSSGFLQLKEGRSTIAHIPDIDEISGLTDSNWFAVHPMYHAGLGLDGFDMYAGSAA